MTEYNLDNFMQTSSSTLCLMSNVTQPPMSRLLIPYSFVDYVYYPNLLIIKAQITR